MDQAVSELGNQPLTFSLRIMDPSIANVKVRTLKFLVFEIFFRPLQSSAQDSKDSWPMD